MVIGSPILIEVNELGKRNVHATTTTRNDDQSLVTRLR